MDTSGSPILNVFIGGSMSEDIHTSRSAGDLVDPQYKHLLSLYNAMKISRNTPTNIHQLSKWLANNCLTLAGGIGLSPKYMAQIDITKLEQI